MRDERQRTALEKVLTSQVPSREHSAYERARQTGGWFTSTHIMLRGNKVSIIGKDDEMHTYSVNTGRKLW